MLRARVDVHGVLRTLPDLQLSDRSRRPCRWKYSLVEEKRPGQYFPVEETKEGTYLFNSQDMCMMEHLDDLIDSGATSLKIEGRAKSAYYIAAMTNAYKTAVNEYMVQRGFEAADGNTLRPFHDRVIRTDAPAPVWLNDDPYAAELSGADLTDHIMEQADVAFAPTAAATSAHGWSSAKCCRGARTKAVASR